MGTGNEKLDRAKWSYEVGDFVTAKRLAREVLAEKETGDDQREQAKSLLRSVGTDPMVTLGFGLTLFVMLFLFIKYLL